jgi:hypothetical protein
MALSTEEKGLLQEAVKVYLQLVSRQLPPQHVQKVAQIAESALQKLEYVGGGKGAAGKPAGISDEWFTNVCKTCDKLNGSICTDKVTEKYPGKCDPILHYERDKVMKGKKK